MFGRKTYFAFKARPVRAVAAPDGRLGRLRDGWVIRDRRVNRVVYARSYFF